MRLNFWKARFYPCPAEMKSLVPVLDSSFLSGCITLDFLSLSTTDILDWRILSFVGCALHFRILAASWLLPTRCRWHSFPPSVTTNSVSRHCQCPLGGGQISSYQGGTNSVAPSLFLHLNCLWHILNTEKIICRCGSRAGDSCFFKLHSNANVLGPRFRNYCCAVLYISLCWCCLWLPQ